MSWLWLLGALVVIALFFWALHWWHTPDYSEDSMGKKIRDTGGAGLCIVGETPALGYTVKELCDRLSQYPPQTPVGMNVGFGSNLQILSLYWAADSDPPVVWFDLGEADEE